MKKRNRFITYISLILSLVSIAAAFGIIGRDKILSVDWSIIGWISLAVAVFALLSVVASTLLMMQRHRILRIYLSTPVSYDKEVSKLREALEGEDVISADNLLPGTSVSELQKIIKKSHCCFFAVGKTQSPMQKEELKIMRELGKKIYVVSMDETGKVPQSLRSEVPLFINDDSFEKKLDSIILEYK